MSQEIVDLDTCAREPIHIPGSIQPHGVLFVLREPELRILQVSGNVRELLGLVAEDLPEKTLSSLLTPEQTDRVRFALNAVDPRDNNPVELQLAPPEGGTPLDGFVHRHAGCSFLELEPSAFSQNARFLQFYKTITKLATQLHESPSMSNLLQVAAVGIREITGYDRVMVYRFAESYEGEVVAEARADEVEPFFGLWFPASDIPEQARKMYVTNPVRVIVDAGYTPSPLVPVLNPETQRPVDLTYAGLRSVSPIHCEYLRNMGVTGTMSVSILRDGRLWGLVACHHFSPKLVEYETRKACTFIGQVLSGEIARREMEAESGYQTRATMVQARFLEAMAAAPHPLLGLVNSTPNLMDLIPCEGAAVVIGEKAHMLGNTPGYSDLMTIVRLLAREELTSTFVTRSLMNHFGTTEKMRVAASGVIALEVARGPASYVLFFRPETLQTVKWGGNPEKPVEVTDDGYKLSPRRSLEVWKEELKGHALPWTSGEVRAANELRHLIGVVLYGREALRPEGSRT